MNFIVICLVFLVSAYPSRQDSSVKNDIDINGTTEKLPDIVVIGNETTTARPPQPNTTIPTVPTSSSKPSTTSSEKPTISPVTTSQTPNVTTTHPATTTVSPKTSPSPPNVTTALPSTTVKPTVSPSPVPDHHRRFDGPSFVGGIVLALGLVAIGFVAFKFYKARTELNYHTL